MKKTSLSVRHWILKMLTLYHHLFLIFLPLYNNSAVSSPSIVWPERCRAAAFSSFDVQDNSRLYVVLFLVLHFTLENKLIALLKTERGSYTLTNQVPYPVFLVRKTYGFINSWFSECFTLVDKVRLETFQSPFFFNGE